MCMFLINFRDSLEVPSTNLSQYIGVRKRSDHAGSICTWNHHYLWGPFLSINCVLSTPGWAFNGKTCRSQMMRQTFTGWIRSFLSDLGLLATKNGSPIHKKWNQQIWSNMLLGEITWLTMKLVSTVVVALLSLFGWLVVSPKMVATPDRLSSTLWNRDYVYRLEANPSVTCMSGTGQLDTTVIHSIEIMWYRI